MTTLIEMMALQRAQSQGREKPVAEDVLWAQCNIEAFEALRDMMGLEVQDNDVLFDDQLNIHR